MKDEKARGERKDLASRSSRPPCPEQRRTRFQPLEASHWAGPTRGGRARPTTLEARLSRCRGGGEEAGAATGSPPAHVGVKILLLLRARGVGPARRSLLALLLLLRLLLGRLLLGLQAPLQFAARKAGDFSVAAQPRAPRPFRRSATHLGCLRPPLKSRRAQAGRPPDSSRARASMGGRRSATHFLLR